MAARSASEDADEEEGAAASARSESEGPHRAERTCSADTGTKEEEDDRCCWCMVTDCFVLFLFLCVGGEGEGGRKNMS